MDLQTRILGYGMLHDDSRAAVRYEQQGAVKVHPKTQLSDEQIPLLDAAFRADPERIIRSGIECLDAIKADEHSDESRLRRYFSRYSELLIALDGRNFSRSNTLVHSGVPIYIPNGFSEMGSDSTISDNRDREKLSVDKRMMIHKLPELFASLFTKDAPIRSTSTIFDVAQQVYKHLPYTTRDTESARPRGFSMGGSIPAHAYVGGEDNGAVCRHQALYTQVLLQTLGFKSRLLKCRVEFEKGSRAKHVANLIEGKDDWYLLDVTNPLTIHGNRQIAITKIPDKNIDLNKNTYEWSVPTDLGVRTYISHSNMYYRIKE